VAGFRIGNDDDGLGERRAHLNRWWLRQQQHNNRHHQRKREMGPK
jgi:hypothetical protein